MMETDRFIAWGMPGGGAWIGLTCPQDGRSATVGTGTMVAPEARDRAGVDRLYALAMSLGAAEEGAPGARGAFYDAYFRDRDGNKLNVFVMGAD